MTLDEELAARVRDSQANRAGANRRCL